MTIKAVIFDIGNVLLEWNPERFYDAEIGPERREALFAKVDLHAMNDRVDMGENFQQTVYETADAHPDFRSEIRLWHDRWIEMASPAIDRSVQALRALKTNGVPVFALSNFGIQSFAFAQTKYDFLSEFDRSYISGHMGVTKPAPLIYQMVEKDCGLAPSSLFFTDDRVDNIAQADARGWQTHLFDGTDPFITRLINAGLLKAGQVT